MKPLAYLCLFMGTMKILAQDVYIVDPAATKTTISPTMWGLFFEDINRSADGGIYAELVKNRSFDFPDPLMGWNSQPSRRAYGQDVFQVINQSVTEPNNPKYLQVTINHPGRIWLSNEGFGGVTVDKNSTYHFGIRYRVKEKGIKLKVDIAKSNGLSIANADITPDDAGEEWTIAETDLITSDSTLTGQLVLHFEGKGNMDIDRISLMPTNTWKGSAKNMRADMVQLLADIKPGFLRFPGGCIVEGKTVENRYQWKNTIGPPELRKLISNQWQEGAAGKPLPDYFQSYGLGFFEYFQLCEDIGAAPMPILNCGLSCQFDAAEVVPVGDMDSYIQDALDLIEFANGDVNTKWGARRVALGHFEPFNMKYLGVGNENWGPQYVERLELFTRAIKEKYPDIQLVTSTGYSPNPQFRYMDSVLRKKNVDIIDEHYYQTANWFLMNASKYDHYDRKGPKIFIGEYACMSKHIGNAENKNTLQCALAEAVFMTGLERNADVVTMAAYAPLFAHVKDWQWTPNLIWFDNKTSYGTPSYYVQQMFSINKGTHVVPITFDGAAIAGQDSVWASAAVDKNSNEVIIKLVNPSATVKKKTISIKGLKKSVLADVELLKGESAIAMNSIDHPGIVKPVKSNLMVKNGKAIVDIAPWSLMILRVKK